jgi:hypothetical protein
MSSFDKIEKRADNFNQGDHEAASANMSREANSKDQLSQISGPGSACIRDNQGYIECGPIVGYPPPQSNPAESTAEPRSFTVPGIPGKELFPKFDPEGPAEKQIPFTKIDPNLRKHLEEEFRKHYLQPLTPGLNVIMDAQKSKK